jgi:hypothetical protein
MRILALTISLLFLTTSYGQRTYTGIWLNAEQSFRIHKDWELGTEQAFRTENTFAKQSFIGFSVKYKGLAFLDPKFAYRFVGRPHSFAAEDLGHRFQLDLNHKRRFFDFDVKLRNRYQIRYQNWFSSEQGRLPDIYTRFKIDLSYPIAKNWEIGVGNEYWLRLSGKEGYFIDRTRIFFGAEYELNKESKISLSYIYQKQLQVSNPETVNILSIEYSYEFDFRKKEDEKMPIKWYRLPTD